MKIKLDMETVETEVYAAKDNDPEYKEAIRKYEEALKTNDSMEIDDAHNFVESVVATIVYKKAFHDGMTFILDALAGKEVIKLL